MNKKEIKIINKISNENQSKYKVMVEDIYSRYCYDVNYEFNIEEFTNKYGNIFKELFKYLCKKKMIKFYKNKNIFKLEYEGFDYISLLFARNRSFSLSINSFAFTIVSFFVLNIFIKVMELMIMLSPSREIFYSIFTIIGTIVLLIIMIRQAINFD